MVFIFSNSVLAKIIKFRITAIMLNRRLKALSKSWYRGNTSRVHKRISLIKYTKIIYSLKHRAKF